VRQSLRVCYFGTYRANYPRNQIMIEGLRRTGAIVIECHKTLWLGAEDRVKAASGGWLQPAFIVRAVRAYWQLLWAYRSVGDYDVMVLGYPGQFDVFLARTLTWLRRKPLVLDVLMSLYLIAKERGLVAKSPLTGRLIHLLEKWALRLPDWLIIDTPAYRTWLVENYNLSRERFRLVPIGADDRIFKPISTDGRGAKFRLVHHSTFLPGTGVDIIIEAAKILANEPDIHFDLVGEGQFKSQAVARAEQLGLQNVTFFEWVDKKDLPRLVAEADACLGVFARAEQSEMTVVNKIYEALAMSKPLITGDSLTVREHIAHGREALLVERGNPQALAEAIVALRDNPSLREKLAAQGHRLFCENFTVAHIGVQARRHLDEILSPQRAAGH